MPRPIHSIATTTIQLPPFWVEAAVCSTGVIGGAFGLIRRVNTRVPRISARVACEMCLHGGGQCLDPNTLLIDPGALLIDPCIDADSNRVKTGRQRVHLSPETGRQS